MAQYYRPRRTAPSSVASEIHIQASLPRDASYRYGRDVDLGNAVASSSVLVFPNPPSDRQSSRDESRFEFTGSTPSLPTDVSLDSSLSRSRSSSRDNEEERSWHDISRAVSRSHDEIAPEGEWVWELDGDDLRSRWDDTRYTSQPRRRNRAQTHTSSNVSSFTGVTPSSLTPQPPFRLPFLSCLQTVLDLDESTLHLLSRSPNPHTSVLFPFPPGPPSPSQEDNEEEQTHGAHKLLLHNPDKAKNGMLLKTAMDPSEIPTDANPLLASSTRIPVWQFLGFVIEGGLRAWREVQVWQASGEPRLVGV